MASKVNKHEKKINLFASLPSDPNAEKDLLTAIAGEGNLSFFMSQRHIYQLLCRGQERHPKSSSVFRNHLG